ncbi:MAG: nucleotidyltransferase [Candidatus Omnitrophica bacterium]|nr:nucleotidyltransferase [Candidatus Omnitrophota bacterium]
MKTEKDYAELLELLNKNKVKYCIIGAYAVAFYAMPRYTKDIDILIEPTPGNARKILKALNEFGFKSLNLSEKDFICEEQIIQLGYEPVRIDIITSISHLDFAEIWKNRKKGQYGKIKVNFIDLAHLIKSKKVSGRKQDKADLELLAPKKKQ